MKRLSRLTALLLAMLMIISTLPVSALASETTSQVVVDIDTWNQWVQDAKDAQEQESAEGDSTQVETETVTTTIPLTSTYSAIERITNETSLSVYSGAETENVESASLPIAGNLILNAFDGASTYQWQVQAAGMWVSIMGDTDSSINLTYAKLQNVMENDVAYVRCVMTANGADYVSATAKVTLDPTITYTEVTSEYEVEVKSEQPVQASYASPARMASYGLTRNADAGIATAAEGDERLTVEIKYVFLNGQQAANSWTATVYDGDDLNETVKSPSVLGYEPTMIDGVKTNATEVVLDYTDISTSITVTVTYTAALVNYTVYHLQQNVNDEKYTEVEADRVTTQGYTEAEVGDGHAKSYPGFYSLLYDKTTKIAADGSTEVEIYYDRYYYLMTFDLDGGYGVEPIYARYGADLGTIGTPTKAGYEFAGWKDDKTGTVYTTTDKFPHETMPNANTSYTAQWNAQTVTYDVVFWYENADDDKYSQAGVIENVSVLAGTEVSGESYATNTTFSGYSADKAKHFTFSHADEKVTVKGDGSTVVNVYFKRNIYTLTFIATGVCGIDQHTHSNSCTLVCGLTEHKHSCSECCDASSHGHRYSSPNTNKCPYKYEHSHSAACYSCGMVEHVHTDNCTKSNRENTVKVISAKYEADIQSYWPIKNSGGFDGTGYWWDDVGETLFTAYTISLDSMPGANITFEGTFTDDDANIHYYVENLAGDTSGREYQGKYYKKYKTVITERSGYLTDDEEFHDIPGFTKGGYTPSGIFSSNGWGTNLKADNYLYYTRNSYTLSFSNQGSTVSGKGGSVQFEAPLKSYNFTPDYPKTLEAGAYVFDGWYESPFFGDTKVDFETAKMPANDLTLYARWVPVNHNVNVYLIKNDDDGTLSSKVGDTQVVAHRETATDPYPGEENNPVNPNSERYTFVGWFYMDGETEKAFDFSMPVTQNLDLYAKWSSNVQMEYTISFELADGTKVADDIKGSALAGTTKTFEALAGKELNTGYQTGYFPHTNSHSLTIDIEDTTKNEFTFIYIPKEKLPYKVMYLEYDGNYVYDGTEKVLHATKTGETPDAIITEKFEPITGYMPDAYQKRLVLSANESENVIYFWYTVDKEHAPVQVIHYIQNAEGNDYTVYREISDLNGVINQPYSTSVLNISGYDYDHATANKAAVTAANGKVSGTVTEKGLLLELYYNREEHPYEFKFLEQGTNNVLAESVTGTARYGAQVMQNAKTIPGYTCVSDAAQDIIIQVEEGTTAVKNVRIFYYEEKTATINYKIVDPDGNVLDGIDEICGTLTSAADTDIKVVTGTVAGSTAAAKAPTYKFVGWFTDAACTTPVAAAWVVDGKITPQKNADGLYEDKTYFAKFKLDVADLTITKTVDKNTTVNATTNTFLFTIELKDAQGNPITDSYDYLVNDGEANVKMTFNAEGKASIVISGGQTVKIKGILIGSTYTVTETPVVGFDTASENTSGSIVASTPVAAFTNTYKVGDLKITKTVTGADAPSADTFTFNVAIANIPAGTYGGVEFKANGTNGVVGTVTINGSDSVVINGLPKGATFTVTEAAHADYALTGSTGTTGTIVENAVQEATFTNTYQYASLTIEKEGILPIDHHAKDGTNEKESQSTIFNVKGNGVDMNVVINGNDSVTIKHLPVGSYTVTEDETWSWRYSADKAEQSVTVNPTGENKVTFNNNRDEIYWLSGDCYAENSFGAAD